MGVGGLLPTSVIDRVFRALGSERIVHGVDEKARAAYAERTEK